MNTRYYFLIVLWAMSLFAPLHAQTYDKMWKEVEQLQKKDLPQSVVSASMKIYDKAKAERDVPANDEGISDCHAISHSCHSR